MTRGGFMRAGIAGHPVTHSLSPLIHGAWIEAAGLKAQYGAYGPDSPDRFDALVAWGRDGGLRGLNVTAPYKEQAFACADTVSDTARDSGSANILVFQDGGVFADSADGEGLLWALAHQAPALSLYGATVVMLGAGGAARAAVAALAGAGTHVRIVNRSQDRAEALARDLIRHLAGSVSVGDPQTAFDGATLVVNALSVPPQIDLGRLDPATVVMDMTYRPVRTPFLEAAGSHGLTTVDGLAMLIGQAGPSFRALFGQPPPDLDPRPLLLAHLGETV